jgi:hypothetical protein
LAKIAGCPSRSDLRNRKDYCSGATHFSRM